MIDLKTRETELATLVNQAKTLYADLEAKGDKATQEDRDKLTKLVEDGKAKRAELDNLKALNSLDEGQQPAAEPKAAERPEGRVSKSWGQHVIGSEQFKQNDGRELMPVKVKGFLPMMGKAVIAGTDASGGYAIMADRQPEILDIARQRPRSVVDLVNQSTTNSDLVEYVIMDTRTNNAAVVAEYSGGNFGLKPESDLTLDLKTAAVNTIATWIAASRQVLNDAPRLRQMIDGELRYMVENALETKLVTDILAWTGIQTRTHASTGSRGGLTTDTIAETLRRAITDIYLEFYRPDGIVLNPADGEKLELLRETSPGVGAFLNIYNSATMTVWRVPVVETPAITAGTALVGNFRMGVTLWDREDTQVLTGQPNDYFLRNAFAILAELREAHAVVRPKAIEKITSLA